MEGPGVQGFTLRTFRSGCPRAQDEALRTLQKLVYFFPGVNANVT